MEERPARGAAAARRTAEILAASLNATATVFGRDSAGEFVYGVFEIAEGAAEATGPVIRKMFAESAAASLTLKDQLLAGIPQDTIEGFATLAASLGYFATQYRQIKRSSTPQISYAVLFRIFCGGDENSTVSLPAHSATLALLSRKPSNLLSSRA